MKKSHRNTQLQSAPFAAAVLAAAAAHASTLNEPLYVGDGGSGVVEYSTSGAATTVSTGTGQNDFDATFDAAGNAYISNYGSGDVYYLPYGGGAGSTYASVPAAFSTAIDSKGNLYVASYSNHYIIEDSGGVLSTFASNVGSSGDLASLAIDSQGDMFASYNSNNVSGGIVEFAASNGLPGTVETTIATTTSDPSLKAPWQIAIDNSGNVYVVNYNSTASAGSVIEFSPSASTYTASTFLSGLTFSGHSDNGLAFDGLGNLFVLAYNGTDDIVQQVGYNNNGTTTSEGTAITVLTTNLTSGDEMGFQIIGSVPEPATTAMCIVGVIGATLRRRRRRTPALRYEPR